MTTASQSHEQARCGSHRPNVTGGNAGHAHMAGKESTARWCQAQAIYQRIGSLSARGPQMILDHRASSRTRRWPLLIDSTNWKRPTPGTVSEVKFSHGSAAGGEDQSVAVRDEGGGGAGLSAGATELGPPVARDRQQPSCWHSRRRWRVLAWWSCCGLQDEQGALGVGAADVAARGAVGSHDAVAGNDNRERVGGACGADGAHGLR